MGFFSKLFGKKEENNGNQLFAPVAGKAVAITEVPDPTFAEGMLGNGIAIIPTDGKVYAPCNATVDMMFDTGHAASLVSDTGVEILIHIGLETVSLEGKPFKVHVKSGDKVKKGDLMIEADLEAIKAAGLNTITPMLVCNTDDYPTFKTTIGKDVTNAALVIEVAKYGEADEDWYWTSRILRRIHRPCRGLPQDRAHPPRFLRRSRPGAGQVQRGRGDCPGTAERPV